MPSNPPDSEPQRRAAVAMAVAALVTLLAVLVAPTAGAAGGDDHAAAAQGTPTTVVSDVGPTSECSPGHIVRRPNCGIPPESPTDPGGWLQVSLFFLVCAAVVGIIAFVWWRSRIARDARRAAGHDPVDMAKAAGQGTRRSTRSDPVAETSSKSPEASAGR